MSDVTDTVASLVTLTDQQRAAVALWEQWIDADIQARSAALGVAPLDPAQVARFKIEAILYRLAHPDDATQVEVQVDDARVSRRYQSSTGQLTYLPGWWAWLGLDGDPDSRQAFTISPHYEPEVCGEHWSQHRGRISRSTN